MRFNSALNIDVKTWKEAKLQRENNIKEFKTDDELPKYGAGSEFGREQREEARRKKFGIVTKKYNPDDQPWVMELGGKGGKKFKGIREGGVTENTSYYVFMKAADGAFEAFPITEWYNFAPIQRYKALSAEEAEEQFCKRDKLLNYFSLMSRKRMKKDEEGEGEEQKSQGKKKNRKDFKISDMDEWITDSDDDDAENEKGSDEENDRPSKKKSNKDGNKTKKKKKEKGSDEEAVEESDEGDFDDREVDYISGSSSDSEEEPEEEKVNREMKGVEDEEALRKLDVSDEEEETSENKETAEEEPAAEDKSAANSKTKQKKTDAASSGDSSSESSDSDFDDNKFQSAMFMQKPKKNGSDNSASSSRANTPTKMIEGKKKRKAHSSEFSPEKKLKHESQPGTPTMSNYSGNDGITEESVRRYLMRKPMTTTELLQKFKSKKIGLNSEQLVTTIAQILKSLNPEKQKIKGKLYLSIKP